MSIFTTIAAALQGKKTFILSALAVASTAAGMYTGHIPIADGIPAILVATGLSTNRAGSKNDAARAAAQVVTELAPIVATAAPSTAHAAEIAEQVAARLLAGVPSRVLG